MVWPNAASRRPRWNLWPHVQCENFHSCFHSQCNLYKFEQGKTTVAADMVLRYSEYFVGRLKRVHISYKRWQSLYEELSNKLQPLGIEVSKSKGLEPPNVQTGAYGAEDWCVWLLDDLGEEIYASAEFAALLATLRHRRVQAMVLLHRAFSGTPTGRAVTANLGVLVFTGSRRQLGDVRSMAAQLGFGASLQAAFLRVCKERDRLSHLLVDLQPHCPDDIRLRARRLSGDSVICFVHSSLLPPETPSDDDDDASNGEI